MGIQDKKNKVDGDIEHFMARLVVQGFTQVWGVDFTETFAPVSKHVSIHVFLAVIVSKGWELHQLNVNNAFLHGDLDEEEIYMKLLPGFSSYKPNALFKLQKSLYGLKQASRNWFLKLKIALREYGFKQSTTESTLFLYQEGDVFLGLLVYVVTESRGAES